jgi:predicted DCC family thiol-disulfide oxidoreductase YuxK
MPPRVAVSRGGLRALQNAIYRWVAAQRYRFRGVTPLCEAEPARCA